MRGGYGRGYGQNDLTLSEYDGGKSDSAGAGTLHLPLIRPTFDVYLTLSEVDTGNMFPPQRFSARDSHLSLCDALYSSDYGAFLEDATLIDLPVPLARRLVTVQSDILMMSEIEMAEGIDLPIRDIAANAIRDMLAYGGCVLLVCIVDGMPEIKAMDPLSWYPLDGGGAVFIRPYISVESQSAMADRIEITIVHPGGEIEVRDHRWQGAGQQGAIGMQADEAQAGGEGVVLTAPRKPELGNWGHSVYIDVGGIPVEISKRYTQNSGILDKNADPAVVWSSATDDLRDRFPASTGQTEDDAVLSGLTKLRKNDAIELNDSTQKVSYLEYGGNLSASYDQIRTSRELMSYLSGLPAVLDTIGQPVASGISLKLQYLPFFAATSALQNDLKEVLEVALDALGLPDAVEWPHIFERLDTDVEQEDVAIVEEVDPDPEVDVDATD